MVAPVCRVGVGRSFAIDAARSGDPVRAHIIEASWRRVRMLGFTYDAGVNMGPPS